MTTASHDLGDTFSLVTYSDAVNAADFAAGDFQSDPSTTVNTGVNQVDGTTLQVTFGFLINVDATITYSGAAPGVLTPQTLAYT